MFTSSLILGAGVLTGCNFFQPNPTPEVKQPNLEVSAGGWLFGNQHVVWTVDAAGVQGDPYSFTAEVKGVLIQPVSGESLVFLEDEDTWSVWKIGEEAKVLYTTKIPLSSCSLAPNGHALACLQQGDLNIIQLTDGRVERVESGVVAATWSPNSSDIFIQFSDRAELLGLDLNDHVASRTALVNETGDHPQFISTSQVIWWKTVGEERHLMLLSLRTKELTDLWSGDQVGQSWVSSQGDRILFSSSDQCEAVCEIQVLSLPQGKTLETSDSGLAAGWLGKEVIVKTPIDQDSEGKYHFATLDGGSDKVLGDARFIATHLQFEIEFTL